MEIYLSLTERLLKSNFEKYERTTAVFFLRTIQQKEEYCPSKQIIQRQDFFNQSQAMLIVRHTKSAD